MFWYQCMDEWLSGDKWVLYAFNCQKFAWNFYSFSVKTNECNLHHPHGLFSKGGEKLSQTPLHCLLKGWNIFIYTLNEMSKEKEEQILAQKDILNTHLWSRCWGYLLLKRKHFDRHWTQKQNQILYYF